MPNILFYVNSRTLEQIPWRVFYLISENSYFWYPKVDPEN